MSIATVVTITGQAWARDPDGNLRELAIGDVLQEGETLVTSTNGSVQLDFADGLPPTLIGGDEEVAITNDVDAENAPTEEETVAQDSEIETLLSVLEEEDGDILELLEATAAGGGAAGGGGGGGADFVQLARIEESVQGLQYDYAVGADEGPETIEFAAAPADADDEIEGNPTAGPASITLDESQLVFGEQPPLNGDFPPINDDFPDGLPGQPPSGFTPGFNSVTATGSIDFSFGPLGAGSIGFAGMDGQTLSIGQESFNLDWDAASNTLTASNERVQSNNPDEPFLFQIQIDPQTGEFTLTLANNLLHEEGTEEALASLVYTVTDAGGNTASNNLDITIVDDVPTAEQGDGVEVPAFELNESDALNDDGVRTQTQELAGAFGS
ncbi:retention module-containing protein, partial [Vreelandella janggokensis]|uniref:retention module-containing protein n=1 Tax=Vreelandella janggokensis TaxID=370767 RepID=UPI00285DE66E